MWSARANTVGENAERYRSSAHMRQTGGHETRPYVRLRLTLSMLLTLSSTGT